MIETMKAAGIGSLPDPEITKKFTSRNQYQMASVTFAELWFA
jgi:hypothetical protein